MSLRKSNSNGGFVALMTAIILIAILLIVTITLNQTSFFTRGILLDSEYKERSSALAEACVDVARLKLANNILYKPINEIVPIGDRECVIRSITDHPTAGQKIIETRATSSESVTNLKVTVEPQVEDIKIVSWEEI